MASITLTKVQDPITSRWLEVISADYDVPRNAQIFWGCGLQDERVAVWVGEDGSGFGAIDGDPDGYVKLSEALERGDLAFDTSHPGVDEYVFEPGTFDPAAETIEFDVRLSFY
jgi:hypothetical protein